MMESDPDPSEVTLYVCRECGDGVENPKRVDKCPECGGLLRNTAVAHD